MTEKISSVNVYPNPSHSSITFDVSRSQASDITILIYDMHGSLVKRVQDTKKSIENYEFVWDRLNKDEEQLHSGLYFYKVYANKSLIGRGRVTIEK